MTIYDIASEAGVSISTVSRVLNNSKRVNPETRKKVQTVLERYNYTPNAMARGLVHNTMRTIGIMAADVRNYHFAFTIYTLENLFFDWGFSVILCNTGNSLEKKKDYIRILAEKKVDGIILVGSVFSDIRIEDEVMKYLQDTPIVVANGVLSVPKAHSVLIDHNWGMEQAVRHLKERGHREILLIRTSQTYNAAQKLRGFGRAMKLFDLPMDGSCVIETQFGLKGGIEAVEKTVSTCKNPTAVIFTDDSAAFSSLRRLRELGYRVPQDMAVVGYDNSDYGSYSTPSLTTVDTKNEVFSTIVANTLHEILRKGQVGSSIILKPELIVREST